MATVVIDITPKSFIVVPATERIQVFDAESDPSLGLGAQLGGLGGRSVKTISDAINTAGNFVNDVINTNLDTSAKTILGDFTFGVSGALQIGTYESGVSGDIKISPAGIIGRNSAGNNTFTLDGTTGNATFAGILAATGGTFGAITGGSITLDTSGFIRAGQTAYNTGTGFWMGWDSSGGGSYKFSLGNPAGDYLYYDGTNVVIKGSATLVGTLPWSSITDDGGKPANYATVGATWGTDLLNIPSTLQTPSASGLYLSGNYLGYYTGTVWNAYIDNSGNFYFKGDANSSIDWNITTPATLTIKGKLVTGAGSSIDGQYLGNATVTGTAIASATITAANITNATITGTQIASGTITSDNIANATITGSDIASATITGSNIALATISGGNIGSATITATNIANATITTTQISGTAGVTGSQLANNTITATQIANATITTTQLSTTAGIVGSQLANNTITATQIANAAITTTQLSLTAGITGSQLANNTITSGQIANATITTTQINGTAGITGSQLANNTISATQITNATITTTQISLTAGITGGQIANNTITASNIVNATITGTQIALATITAANITNATITGSQIASGTITASNIHSATITATEIVNGTITSTQIANATIVATNISATAGIAGSQLAASAGIVGTQIANTTITGGNLANNTITATQIGLAAITGACIANTTIAGGNLINNTITATQIANSTITGTQIAATTIAGSNLINNTVTATQIANATITGTQIASSTIAGSNVANNTITTGKLSIPTHIITGTFVNADPSTGYVSWLYVTVDYSGATYLITNSNTNKKYIWWDYSLSTTDFQGSDALPTLANDDCLVGLNNSGVYQSIWNATGTNGATIENATITGGSIANTTITGANIVNNTITATQIANATITTTQISGTAGITGGQIANTTITASNITNATITHTQISDTAAIVGSQLSATAGITGTQIANATITTTQISGTAGITGSQLANNTITATQIQNASITTTQISNTAGIVGGQIANNTITATNITNATITATQIANATITATQIANTTITASQIANLTITADQIANATITTGKIVSLNIDKLNSGTITSKTITLAADTTDCFIASGKTDFGQDTTTGFILGRDYSDSNKAKLELTGGTITGSTIQTATTGVRTVITGNDVYCYDDTTGGITIGDLTTQFDITNTSGTTFRYTYDGTGTNPNILTYVFVGKVVDISDLTVNFSAGNRGVFTVTGVDTNYFEVTNSLGVVESNKTIGTGSISVSIMGDSASIYFPRTDNAAKRFVIRKRASIHTDSGNVMEMFYDDEPTSGYNYLFLGRVGDDTTTSAYHTNFIVNNTKDRFDINHSNSVLGPVFFMAKSDTPTASTTWGLGDAGGTRTYYSFVDCGTTLVTVSDVDFRAWDTITGVTSGATAYIGTKNASGNFTLMYVIGTFVVGETLTTDGVGGGSGTAVVSSTNYSEFNMDYTGGGALILGSQMKIGTQYALNTMLWLDSYQIHFDFPILPYTDNKWIIGDSTHTVKQMWVGTQPTDDKHVATKYYADNAPNVYIIGDGTNLLASADTLQSEAGVSYVKKKQITITGAGGSLRVKWQLETNASGTAFIDIRVNGMSQNVQSTTATTWQNQAVTLTGIKPSDTIECWLKHSDPDVHLAEVQNFRIYGVLSRFVVDTD